MVEWAAWWNKTIERWIGDGMPAGLSFDASRRYFGLDVFLLHWRECIHRRNP
jgi:hypothetical protein